MKQNLNDHQDMLPDYPGRLRKLKESLKKKNLKFFLTEDPANRLYLTGFTGSTGWVLVSEDGVTLFVDSRYTELAQNQSPPVKVNQIDTPFDSFWESYSRSFEGERVGYESHKITHRQVLELRDRSRAAKLNLVSTQGVIEKVRSVKDPYEIAQIQKSVDIADRAFAKLLVAIKPGQTEIEIAWLLEKLIREEGAERVAWHPFIVAVGANSSMPHYHPGKAQLQKQDMLQLDFGAVVNGYCSDISRVVFMGKPTADQRKVYQVVWDAQESAMRRIHPGAKSKEVDAAAREVVEKAGYKPYGHGLSHGIGLEVHELPSVSLRSTDVLQEGNVISVEPGIYIPGWGGIRIEDLVLVTKSGCETLTKSPKDISKVTI